jgi:hypothetical protein
MNPSSFSGMIAVLYNAAIRGIPIFVPPQNGRVDIGAELGAILTNIELPTSG